MLTAYIDESGLNDASEIVVVGGYVSRDDLWERFATEWAKLLKRYRVSTLHAADVVAGRKEFKGWPREKRAQVLQEADALIARFAGCGIVSYVRTEDCEQEFPVGRGPGKRKKYSAEYLFSSIATHNGITVWMEDRGVAGPVKIVQEEGVKGRGLVENANEFARKRGAPRIESIAHSIEFGDKTVPQLQAADRLVHLARRSIEGFLRDSESQDSNIETLTKLRLQKVYEIPKVGLKALIDLTDKSEPERKEYIEKLAKRMG